MKRLLNIILCSLLSLGIFYSQEKEPDYKPYTIEATYQKLKKDYPFIKPIQPLISDEIVAKEHVVYKEVDTIQLILDVYYPKDTTNQNYPAVLLIHGGGWLTGSKENQRSMAQHLALNGYVAVTANYRTGLQAPYPAAVIDLKDAIKWMRTHSKKHYINPDKIAVLGASAGGHLATLLGITSNSTIYGFDSKVSEEIQAIVNIDGIVSFIHPEASSEGKMASIWLNGSREENFKNWKEASPLEYITESSPPVLFINSSQPRFHAGRDDMIVKLNEFNIYNNTHTIENTPHSFWLLHPWFKITLNYTLDFLNKVLKDR